MDSSGGHLPATVDTTISIIFGDGFGRQFRKVSDGKTSEARLKTLVVRREKDRGALDHNAQDLAQQIRMIAVDVKGHRLMLILKERRGVHKGHGETLPVRKSPVEKSVDVGLDERVLRPTESV